MISRIVARKRPRATLGEDLFVQASLCREETVEKGLPQGLRTREENEKRKKEWEKENQLSFSICARTLYVFNVGQPLGAIAPRLRRALALRHAESLQPEA